MPALEVSRLQVDRCDRLLQFTQTVLERRDNRQHIVRQLTAPTQRILQAAQLIYLLQFTNVNIKFKGAIILERKRNVASDFAFAPM